MKLALPLLLLAFALAAPASAAPPQVPTPAAVQEILAQNLALGDSLAGRPADPKLAARVEQTVTDGVASARALVAADPKSAEAHDLLGLFLTVAYRPPSPRPAGVAPLRRGSAVPAEAKEGLEELRAAATREPKAPGYRLDYAWALVLIGEREQAKTELRAITDTFPALPARERDRLKQLQAQAVEAAPPATAAPAAVPTEITWLSFDDALAAARRDHKRVLVDFTAEWCTWCKRMATDVFPKPEVIALSQNYAFARVDADQQPEVARRYKVSGFPTVVAVDAEGKELKRAVGYKSPQEFVDTFQ